MSEGRNFFYRAFCSGGINKEDPLNPLDNKENGLMVFFRDHVAAALNTKWVKVLIMAVFCVYICTAFWGMSQLREGLERRRLAKFDSYSIDFYNLEDGFFREYPYRINVRDLKGIRKERSFLTGILY